MAFQSVPNTAEITFVFSLNGKNVVNTIHAERLGGYDAPQITTLAAAMDTAANTFLKPQMVIDAQYLRVEVRGLDSENDFAASNDTNTGQGAIVGPGLPGNVTLSVKRSSVLTGRSARGRWYYVGLASGELTANENFLDANVALNKAIAVDGLRARIVIEGWVPVIVSRFTGGVKRTFGATFEWVATTVVNNDVDSQRGRLGG
jgi:hypothetical protein